MSINDLYFRPFDKARLDRLTEAIVQEKLSAALVSESEGLLGPQRAWGRNGKRAILRFARGFQDR